MNTKDIRLNKQYKLIRHPDGEATLYEELSGYIGQRVTIVSQGLGVEPHRKHFRVRFQDGVDYWRVWNYELAPVDSGFAEWVRKNKL